MAQTEKEASAPVFGEKFHHYLYRRDFIAETGLKPVEKHNEETSTSSANASADIDVTVQHKRGKSIPVATVSRKGALDGSVSHDTGLDVYVHAILKQMPLSDTTKNDNELQRLQKYV